MAWHPIRRIEQYLDHKPWPIVPFQPVLFLFLWAASIRLLLSNRPPPDFTHIAGGPGFYNLWLGMGIIGPMMALASWFLVKKRSGRTRFIGMWVRLGGDIVTFTSVLTYHVSLALEYWGTEERIYARYAQGAVLVFMMSLIVRDIWMLILVERLARDIHRES